MASARMTFTAAAMGEHFRGFTPVEWESRQWKRSSTFVAQARSLLPHQEYRITDGKKRSKETGEKMARIDLGWARIKRNNTGTSRGRYSFKQVLKTAN
jgi:hypothetical protein